MKITILKYIEETKGKKVGLVDFHVNYYTNDKTETFRNVAYFEDGDRKWLSEPKILRDEKWVALYERTPPLNNLLKEVLKVLEEFLQNNK
jgi:hypothetical protein